MIKEIPISDKALKDMKSIPKNMVESIMKKIENMIPDMTGDVKRLTNYTPEYRLRIGDYRVLFEVEGNIAIIYRVKHRKDVYRMEGK